MKEMIAVIMRRDGLSKEEATEEVQGTLDECRAAIESGRFMLAEEIFMEDLGLEIDYLMNAIA